MIHAPQRFYKYFLALLVFNLGMGYVHGQDQRVADSLKMVYENSDLQGEERLKILGDLAFYENRDVKLRQEYARELIEQAEQADNKAFIYSGYLQLGNALRMAGDITSAINAYFKSLSVAREIGDEENEGHSLMTIADTYSSIEDRENAITYYKNSIELIRETQGKLSYGIVLFNLGDELIKLARYDEASEYLDEAGDIFEEETFDLGLLYVQGNRGVITGKTGDPESGIQALESTVEKLLEYEDYYAASSYMIYLAELHNLKGDTEAAVAEGEKALQMAMDKNLQIQIRDAHKVMYRLYSNLGSTDKSIQSLQNYYTYRDSIYNVESVKEIATLRYNADMTQKQAEVDLLNQQRRNQRIVLWATGIVALLLSMLAVGMYRKNKYVRKTNEIIDNERRRSENLLLNILPKQTAQELKEKGKVKAKKFDSASVLFTDFVDFSKYAEKLTPEKLVKGMDFYYGQFDKIIDKYGLEKIKTVGDSYMCAGGIPNADPDHAVKIVQAAEEIVAFVEKVKEARQRGKTRFDIRIGINSGPLVAGVVGTKKFAYDIWGDTVNVAARMETKSEPGRINISENTYELVKHQFDCEYRGEIAAKNKGRLKMYFVNGKTEQLASKAVHSQLSGQTKTPV